MYTYIIQYLFLDASTEATMLCSGSGSVLIEEKEIYYCPDESTILTFQCNVQDSNILLWRVSPSNNVIRISPFTSVNKILTDGYITAFLKVVQTNSDFSKNNFTSIMLLDTKDVVGPITTVTCETSDAERFESHCLRSLGNYACMYVRVYMYTVLLDNILAGMFGGLLEKRRQFQLADINLAEYWRI